MQSPDSLVSYQKIAEKDKSSSCTSSTNTSFFKKSVSSSYYGSLGKEIHPYNDSIATGTGTVRNDEYFIPVITDHHSDNYSRATSATKTSSGIPSSDMVLVEGSRSVSPWIWNMGEGGGGEGRLEDQEYICLLKHQNNDETGVLFVSKFAVEESHLFLTRGHETLVIKKPGFFLSKVLGFQSNPFIHGDDCRHAGAPVSSSSGSRNSPMADLRLSMLSTLSTSYNTLSICWAIQIMSKIYPINEGEQSICSTALLVGMIFGQLFGGALGDYIGRHRAMTFVMLTQIFAALASAFCFDRAHYDSFNLNGFRYHFDYPENFTIFKMLAMWRFLLGIGCGGVYPLSATLTAESTSCPQDRGKLVALTFSMQGIGYLLVPLFCWALIGIFGEVSDLSWRIMLGSGSIFGIILILLRTTLRRRQGQVWESGGGTTATATTEDSVSSSSKENKHHDSKNQKVELAHSVKYDEQQQDMSHHHHYKQYQKQYQQKNKPSIMEAIRKETSLTKKLIGTAGCWFLLDVLFYGNTLFQPVVLHSVFGSQETLLNTARDSSIMAILALPGYFISIACVGRQSPRFIQLQGFLCMGILYFIVGYNFESLSKNRAMLLVLYGFTFFFSDYGPNTTTFMLPSMTFSPHCRSTLNGISAACGKIGAVIGTFLFEPAALHFGTDVVLMICSGLCILGAIMTWVGVTPNVGLGRIDSTTISQDNSNSNTRTSASGEHANKDMIIRIKFTSRDRNKSAPSFLDYNG